MVHELMQLETVPSAADLAGTGWTPDAVRAIHAATMLDRFRHLDEFGQPDEVGFTLDLHGEDQDARYPHSSTLESMGCDLPALLDAAVDGLDLDLFGQAVAHGMNVAEFSVMLAQRIDSMEEVNAALDLFIESQDDQRLMPDPVVRSLSRLFGESEIEWVS